ncbi:hypothetical protein TNCV_3740021 [Trichonephila clavipes]|nr:hypothetical protein TNCV_3740021 [Trichonephila clavipes]
MEELNFDQDPRDINKEKSQLERVRLQAFVAATDPGSLKELIRSAPGGKSPRYATASWDNVQCIIDVLLVHCNQQSRMPEAYQRAQLFNYYFVGIRNEASLKASFIKKALMRFHYCITGHLMLVYL